MSTPYPEPLAALAGQRRVLQTAHEFVGATWGDRALAAGLLSLATLALIRGQPAAPALVTGLTTWFLVTGRSDLAPGSPAPRGPARRRGSGPGR